MKKFIFLLFFGFLNALLAEIPPIKGLILVGHASDVVYQPEVFEGIRLQRLNVPGGEAALLNRLTPILPGKTMAQEDIEAIKKAIFHHWRDQKLPVMTVLTPEQDVTDGILQLIVMESRIREVEYTGNDHFSSSLLNKYLELKPGDQIDVPRVLSNVARMNKNPFHHSEIVFSPGKTDGTTDVRIVTQDRPPLRLFGGADDTGNDYTGNIRWIAGFNWANLFGADQVFTYQYTGSNHIKNFFAHTVNYTIPLPHAQSLAVYGGYTEIYPDVIDFEPLFSSAQASSRYNFPIGKIYAAALQDFSLGFDFKATDNTLAFTGAKDLIHRHRANITQLVLGYHFGVELESHKISIEPEIFISPAEWIPYQSKRAFNQVRMFASPKYIFGRLTAEDHFTFSSWELGVQSRLQLSNRNLLPSEQFSLGGYNTVRGYAERAVNLDNALCLNGELKTPEFSFFKWAGKKVSDKFQLLAFADYALGRNTHLIEQEKSYEHLLGVGPGMRYNIFPFLTSRLDWAFPLIALNGEKLRQRIHFSVLLSY